MNDRPMIIPMATTTRAQRRYDHRFGNLVQRTGATDLGVPRPTARGWLSEVPKVVVGVDVTDLMAPQGRRVRVAPL